MTELRLENGQKRFEDPRNEYLQVKEKLKDRFSHPIKYFEDPTNVGPFSRFLETRSFIGALSLLEKVGKEMLELYMRELYLIRTDNLGVQNLVTLYLLI